MDPKILTENGWKAITQKFKVKDNGLQKALATYEKLEEDGHDDCLKTITLLNQLAANLKKAKEVAALPVVVKYLTDLLNALQSEQRDVAKAKVDAQKSEAMTRKKADEEAKKREQEAADARKGEHGEDEEEEEEGDHRDKLLSAFKRLKGSKELEYHFIVCDAKPQCGVILSKQPISAKHKAELTKVTGGSKRFLKPGKCRVDGGKLVFDMEEAPAGLAAKLKKSFKYFTGLNIGVLVGDQSDEDEAGPEAESLAEEAARPAAGDINPVVSSSDEPKQGQRPGDESSRKAGETAKSPSAAFIGASVGRRGKNKPEDVKAVQEALNHRVKAGLRVDGKCGPETIKAIEDLQRQLGQFKPDGLIEPGRGTARALTGRAKIGPAPEPPKPMAPPKLEKPTLAKAPTVWRGMREFVDKNINELKKGVRAQYGAEHPDLLKEIDENMGKLDVIIEKLDHRLADSLERAYAHKDEAARKTELKKSKTILAEYINYVKSEPLIAHIDANPFGVDTRLGKTIKDHLMHVAQAIG